MQVDKSVAIWLLKLQHNNPTIVYPFYIMCKDYGDDDDFVGIEPEEWELMQDAEYQTFELWKKESFTNN